MNFSSPRVSNDIKIEIVAPRASQQHPRTPQHTVKTRSAAMQSLRTRDCAWSECTDCQLEATESGCLFDPDGIECPAAESKPRAFAPGSANAVRRDQPVAAFRSASELRPLNFRKKNKIEAVSRERTSSTARSLTEIKKLFCIMYTFSAIQSRALVSGLALRHEIQDRIAAA